MTTPAAEARIIKKYSNRRLYDTHRSRYVTLHDLRGLVLENRRFVVVDVRSEADITEHTLLQVLTSAPDPAKKGIDRSILIEAIRAQESSRE